MKSRVNSLASGLRRCVSAIVWLGSVTLQTKHRTRRDMPCCTVSLPALLLHRRYMRQRTGWSCLTPTLHPALRHRQLFSYSTSLTEVSDVTLPKCSLCLYCVAPLVFFHSHRSHPGSLHLCVVSITALTVQRGEACQFTTLCSPVTRTAFILGTCSPCLSGYLLSFLSHSCDTCAVLCCLLIASIVSVRALSVCNY